MRTTVAPPTIKYSSDNIDGEYRITLPELPHIGHITWCNAAHAAIHSLLAALKYNRTADAWLASAERQIKEARAELQAQINS